MTDNSTNQPAAVKSKLIKTGLLSHQQQQQASLLKQPLSSLNTNHNILNNQNNNNHYYEQQQQQHFLQARRQQRHDLNNISDDALKSDVQIVLNNIQNALLNQQKQQQQQDFYQDRFQYLNIFGGQSPPTKGNAKQARNLTRKMSASPADCDNTNNNNMMGPTSMLGCSFASDFTHDNSDYQWFVDYG
jgi:hypothetical protein